jgi:hypothetical protein
VNELERILAALSAAGSTPDQALRTLYLAAARSSLTAMRGELDAAERVLVAHENELLRVTRVT